MEVKLSAGLQYACSDSSSMSQGTNDKGAKRVWLHPENRDDKNTNCDPRPATQ